ncbi:structural cement protein Gp24 [Pararhizobium sp. PWRC1-1]|uniref:structural cement protein Gp24 n=1 Tax=Pararhizobium sp. PWRC1-1 TaxID=2804566 RepID=UPI003CF115BD
MVFPTVSYSRDTPAGYPGMIATTEPGWNISAIVEAGSGDIPFGRGVIFGTIEDTVKLPTALGKFAGVAIADRTVPAANGEVFKPYDQLSVRKNGSIWVTALVAVAQGDPVYMTPTGTFTNVANSAANQLIENAEWASVTSGTNQLARLRLGVTK